MHNRFSVRFTPQTNDFSLYETQYCPDCDKLCLVATDDPEKRREWSGQRHVCGDLGKSLNKQGFPTDLGPRPSDDLKKSFYEDRNEPKQAGASKSTLEDNRG